jgi:hypothetical protein
MERDTTARCRIYGVDFSGARDAGDRIWIASGLVEEDALRIEACCRARELPGSARDRGRCLEVLRGFVAREKDAAFGFDFPFGLPRELVPQDGWDDFVLSFPEAYVSPEAFRRLCWEDAERCELRRVTDQDSKAPLSPYNLRLYRQTYYGIHDVLHPLVRDRLVCVLPMQPMCPDMPWVLEICPASTLKREKLYGYRPYKGRADTCRANRKVILGRLRAASLMIPERVVRSTILEDRGGDALDSVVAAWAVFRALHYPGFPSVAGSSAYAIEGYVYV